MRPLDRFRPRSTRDVSEQLRYRTEPDPQLLLLHLPCIPTIRKGLADDRPRVLPPSAAYEHFTDHESVRIVEKHVSRDFEYFGHLFPRLSTASGRPSGEELVDVSEWYAGVRAEAEAAETSHEG